MDRLKELAGLAASIRAEIKQDANDLKIKRKYLKEIEHEMDELADPNLDLKCEIA